ncbi:MAG: 5-oxoprolinase subunit PxpB [Pseudomonadota bacterium]
MTDSIQFDIQPFGERGWLARLSGFAGDVESGLFANAAADAIRLNEGVTDAVAGIDSVTMRFDPTLINAEMAMRTLSDAIEKTGRQSEASITDKEIEIPVLYGGEAGPDLELVCERNQLSPAEYVERHTRASYRVITLGFAPGFTYLGPLDEKLQAPRLATPRPRLTAGSVGVAGGFTGVYSLPSPGGWNIIGRTPHTLFDAQSPSPFFFKPGVSVRFRSIDETEFKKHSKQNI